jgi:hypothetical protein
MVNEGLFSQEEYSENSNRHDDEQQSSSLGMIMKSSEKQHNDVNALLQHPRCWGCSPHEISSQKLTNLGWHFGRMGEALDILYNKMKEIVLDGNKLPDEDFAMGICKVLED